MEWTDADHIDLGGGHSYVWLLGDPQEYPTDDVRFIDFKGDGQTLVGLIEFHPKPGGPVSDVDDGQCAGGVYFVAGTGLHATHKPIWTVVSLDPLHLEPSILCRPPYGCGNHGYIRNGLWEDAG